MELQKVPTISGDAHTYLTDELSADTQLKRGLIHNSNQSEGFLLGYLAALCEAKQTVDRMFYRQWEE